jgi:hypothetical protein
MWMLAHSIKYVVFIGVVVEKINNLVQFPLIFHFLSQSKTMT